MKKAFSESDAARSPSGRFDPVSGCGNVSGSLMLSLENIEEIQHLKELLREAVRVPTLDKFKRILASNGN